MIRANLDPSYLALPIPISGLPPVWFEASLVAHFFVHRPAWPWAVVFTPEIVVRMFREPSQPVKTPSYVPRLALFAWLPRRTQDRASSTFAALTLGHHSNGQAGPLLLQDGRINRENGDFYTNYLQLAAFAVDLERRMLASSQIAIEWHPPFVQHPDLRERYGSLRVHAAGIVLQRLPLDGRLSARLTAILDDLVRATDAPLLRALERLIVSLRYTLALPGTEIGFYGSYYFGHDYYNVYFDRLLHTFQLGIASRIAPSLAPLRP